MATLQPDEKICPYCAETIKAAAVRCRYCRSDLATEPLPPPPVPESVGAAHTGVTLSQPEPARPPGDGGAPDRGPAGGSLLSSLRLLKVLVVLCLVLVLATGLAWWHSQNPPESEAATGAITSAQARDAGLQAATELTQKVLSYDWKTLEQDIKAAEAVMAPSFRVEYGKAMAGVKDQTVKNQVKLTANAVATSIVSASEREVKALVFVNQVTTAKGTENQRLDQNRVLVTLTRDGGDWRVSKMDAF